MTLSELDQAVDDIVTIAHQKGGLTLTATVQSVLKPAVRASAQALRRGDWEITGPAEEQVNYCFERAKALIPG